MTTEPPSLFTHKARDGATSLVQTCGKSFSSSNGVLYSPEDVSALFGFDHGGVKRERVEKQVDVTLREEELMCKS